MSTFKQRIRMTASEIAMGRYMRAPDHPPADDDAFSRAFDQEVLEGNAASGGGGDAPADASGDGTGAPAPVADGGGDGTAAPAGDGAGADGGNAASPDGQGAAPASGGEAVPASPPADDKGDAASGVAEAGGEGASGAAVTGDGVAEAGAGTAAVPDKGKDVDALIDRLADAVASKAPVKAEAPADVAEVPAERPPLFNDTEQATLSKFKEDWPGEYEAITLMQRELGIGVIQHIFDQLAPVVREIKDTADALALRAQVADVTAGLTEYPTDEEIDKVREWVKTQPTYLQSGMNSVIDGGAAGDVVDLVSRYREATGLKPAGAPAEGPKPQAETELSGPAKQAAEALAPVGSKRSAVQSPDDTSNFDGAWEKYVSLEV